MAGSEQSLLDKGYTLKTLLRKFMKNMVDKIIYRSVDRITRTQHDIPLINFKSCKNHVNASK